MNTGSPERAIPASYTHTLSLGLDALRPSNPKHKISKAFMFFFRLLVSADKHCTLHSLVDRQGAFLRLLPVHPCHTI